MSKTVMIVDDSALIRRQVTLALESSGVSTVEAFDGLDALTKLTPGCGVGLVICDVNMPRMDGIQFLEELRDRAGEAPPVIMLTTESQFDLLVRAKELGAKAWITKPFKPEVIIATVAKLVA